MVHRDPFSVNPSLATLLCYPAPAPRAFHRPGGILAREEPIASNDSGHPRVKIKFVLGGISPGNGWERVISLQYTAMLIARVQLNCLIPEDGTL